MYFLFPQTHNELLDRFLNAEAIPDEQIIDLTPSTDNPNNESYEIPEIETITN